MKIVSTHFTVVDFCQTMERHEIVVNKEYQRSDKVWPPPARSFFLETILLGFPFPKLSLHQVTDIKSRKTIKEIVDGQQRSMAILDFFQGKLRLSNSLETEEVAGKIYSELGDEFKQRFLDYQITVDLFVSANRDEVREVFRRMNSYTVPLNPEERRHALFQGPFKWFVQKLARRFDENFLQMDVFKQQQLVRMADTKLIAEMCHALLNGIKTTNARMLDGLYKDREKDFPEERELESRLSGCLDELIAWTEIHGGSLMKPYTIYSLLLAITHMRKPVPQFQQIYQSPRLRNFNREVVILNLTTLSEALENPDARSPFSQFVAACSSKTNVKDQRETRFLWFCKALQPEAF